MKSTHHQWYRWHSFIWCQLVLTSSDDESPVRTELCSPGQHNLCHYLTPTSNKEQLFTDVNSIAWDDDTTSSEENFPTAPLDDEVWSEASVPDRQLCFHEAPHDPNHQCSYPCPCSTTTFRIDLPQPTPQDTVVFFYEQMDFCDISSDFLTTWQQPVTMIFLILRIFPTLNTWITSNMRPCLHKHSLWLYLE